MIKQQPAMRLPGSTARDAVVLGLAYFVLAALAIHLAKRQPEAVANVWFANAAAMAIFACSQRSRWLVLLGSMVISNVAAGLASGISLALALSFVPGNVVEILAGAWLLRRHDLWRRFDHDSTAFVRMLAAGAVLPELLGATLGAFLLQWHGFAAFHTAWLDWYVGSVLGATAVLPAALILCQTERAQAWRQLTSRRALLLLLVTIAFGLLALYALPLPLVYLSLPLIAAAFLLTPLGALALCFVVVATVTAAIAYGLFEPPVFVTEWQTVLLFTPVIAVLVPAQLLAVLMGRKRVLVETLTALNSVTSDITAFCDRHGVVQRVNRAFEEYMQCISEDSHGHTLEEVIPANMFPKVRRSYDRALAGENVRAQTEVDFPGRGKRSMDVSFEPARDANGQILGVVYVAHDVTDLVAARNELERSLGALTERTAALVEAKHRAESADRLKSAFLATMSHELRTPLNSVIGFTGILIQGLAGPLNEEQRKQLGMVQGSARHLLALINDVLDLSKIEAGELRVRCEPFDLRAAIETITATVAPLAQKKGLALGTNIGPLIGILKSDQRRVEQVLLNLLSNAIKFTERGGVTLEVTPTPAGVQMKVSDTGIGIQAPDLARLFQPFSQVDTGLARSSEGSGLGLVICRRLAGLLGGGVDLKSEWGKGTVVTFTLPTGMP